MREDERLYQLANDTAMGRGVAQDYRKAAFLCQKAADMGNLNARFVILASTYKPFRPYEYHDVDSEETVPFRYLNYRYIFDPVDEKEEAMKLLKECAEYGIVEAQYLMAVYGKESERDEWMREAADQKFLPAMRRLMKTAAYQHNQNEYQDWKIQVFLAEGNQDRNKYTMDGTITPEYADWLINVPADEIGMDENRKYFRKAAEAGYAEAQVRLANTYGYEDPQFLYWMEKAGEQNNWNACEDLMDFHAVDRESDEKYVYWLKRGADHGDPYLQYYLADYYAQEEISEGVKNPRCNPEAAMEYYSRIDGPGRIRAEKRMKELENRLKEEEKK